MSEGSSQQYADGTEDFDSLIQEGLEVLETSGTPPCLYSEIIAAASLGNAQTQLAALQLLETEIAKSTLDVLGLISPEFSEMLCAMINSTDLEVQRNSLNLLVSEVVLIVI